VAPKASKPAKSKPSESAAPLDVSAAKELESIKRLLILQLITSGVKSTSIAKTLGISNSAVTRMVPARQVKRKSKGT
jgi:DNA-binding NarL/FixJ family response regulator